MKKKLISIPDYQVKFINEYQKEHETSQSEVIRRALDYFIESKELTNKNPISIIETI